MLNNVTTLLSAVAPLGLVLLLWVMAQISHRFGEVTHRPPIYRAFYVALGLMLFPLVVRLLTIGLGKDKRAELGGNAIEALLYDLPMALGITLALIIAWRYWGWLIYAREGQSPVSTRR